MLNTLVKETLLANKTAVHKLLMQQMEDIGLGSRNIKQYKEAILGDEVAPLVSEAIEKSLTTIIVGMLTKAPEQELEWIQGQLDSGVFEGDKDSLKARALRSGVVLIKTKSHYNMLSDYKEELTNGKSA